VVLKYRLGAGSLSLLDNHLRGRTSFLGINVDLRVLEVLDRAHWRALGRIRTIDMEDHEAAILDDIAQSQEARGVSAFQRAQLIKGKDMTAAYYCLKRRV